MSSIAADDWKPDPEVGGEMHVLIEGEGATTTWHLTLPFKEPWFFGRAYELAAE